MADNDKSITSIVFQGSYKGYPILINSAGTEGGRKFAKHEYPNRDDQSIEDLGMKPRAYNLELIVGASTPSEYITNKEALLRVLETPGPGILIHPLFGSLKNISAVSWSLNEDMGALGDAALSVVFELNNSTGVPDIAGLSISQVQQKLKATIDTQTKEFGKRFKVDKSKFGNASAAIAKVRAGVSKISSSTASLKAATASATEFNNQLAALNNDVVQLILDPPSLIASINEVFNALESLYETPSVALKTYSNMFGFGSDDKKFTKLSNATNTQRDSNNDLLNGVMNVSSLAGAYMASAEIEYATVDEIDADAALLDAQFEAVMTNENIPYAIRKSLNEARVDIEQLNNDKRVRAAEMISVYTNTRPARLISFEYYNDSTRGEEISLLNNQADLSFIQGTINILSEHRWL